LLAKPEERKECALEMPTGTSNGKLTGKAVAAYKSTNPLYAVPTILLLVAIVGIITLSRTKLSNKTKTLITISHFVLIALAITMLSLTFFESSIIGNVAKELPITKEQINIGVIVITIIAGATVLALGILFVKKKIIGKNETKHQAVHHWKPHWHQTKSN
jgi:energy-converting hydrogenase Eha subunit A